RAAPAAPKVAPASREAIPPGSADPSGTSAVCAVDAELFAVLSGLDIIVEWFNNCSSICLAEESSDSAGTPPRRLEFADFLEAPLSEVALDFRSASKTLPISSPFGNTPGIWPVSSAQ
ncbi:MAG: hypothetical protein C5B44_05110, partial [Acidobacteria bacterium]